MRNERTTILTALVILVVSLAGCHEPAAPDDDHGLPTDGSNAGGTSELADGEGPPGDEFQESLVGDIHVSGTIRECDVGHCIDATATNEGTETYHISNMCVPPWSDKMRDADGNDVQHREPMFYCAAFGTKEFPPQSSETVTLEWDHQVWNDPEGKYEPAPAGTYHWDVTFVAYEGSGGEGRTEVTVTWTLTI